MDSAAKYQIVDEYELKLMPDGYVIYQQDNEQVHYLNPTASMVLELCRARLTAEEISQYVGSKFDLAEMPLSEVEDCLRDLIDKGLIKTC